MRVSYFVLLQRRFLIFLCDLYPSHPPPPTSLVTFKTPKVPFHLKSQHLKEFRNIRTPAHPRPLIQVLVLNHLGFFHAFLYVAAIIYHNMYIDNRKFWLFRKFNNFNIFFHGILPTINSDVLCGGHHVQDEEES